MKLKNERKVLQMFCDEDSWRDTFQHPWVNELDEGRVWATDGHALLIVDRHLTRGTGKEDGTDVIIKI